MECENDENYENDKLLYHINCSTNGRFYFEILKDVKYI